MKSLVIAVFIVKVITAQRTSYYQQPIITETIIEAPPLPSNTDALCKDLASAIQGVIFSKISNCAARRPGFGQLAGPLLSQIAGSCSCPLCSGLSPVNPGLSSGALVNVPCSANVPEVIVQSKPLGYPVLSGIQTVNALPVSACGCSSTPCNCGINSAAKQPCTCQNTVVNPVTGVYTVPNRCQTCQSSGSVISPVNAPCNCQNYQAGLLNTGAVAQNLGCQSCQTAVNPVTGSVVTTCQNNAPNCACSTCQSNSQPTYGFQMNLGYSNTPFSSQTNIDTGYVTAQQANAMNTPCTCSNAALVSAPAVTPAVNTPLVIPEVVNAGNNYAVNLANSLSNQILARGNCNNKYAELLSIVTGLTNPQCPCSNCNRNEYIVG